MRREVLVKIAVRGPAKKTHEERTELTRAEVIRGQEKKTMLPGQMADVLVDD